MEVLLVFGLICLGWILKAYIAPSFYPPWKWWRARETMKRAWAEWRRIDDLMRRKL